MVPFPSQLNPEERLALQVFSVRVFGEPIFTDEPAHNGSHGHSCEFCSPVLAVRDAERERVANITQPWHGMKAA